MYILHGVVLVECCLREHSKQRLAKYINDNFYAVKFNAEGNEEVTYKGTTYKNNNYDPAKANTRNGMHDFCWSIGCKLLSYYAYF